ncbi:MAG: NAD(P)H-quinone oxidoreductase subunit 3 [Actinomycetia bacterium]|nr:NAD(P)H-quinone oxidoreductase subunit 3 [Actinomycetes bacterium]
MGLGGLGVVKRSFGARIVAARCVRTGTIPTRFRDQARDFGTAALARIVSRPVSDFLREYFIVVIFGLLGAGVVGAFLGLARLLRPTRPSEQKYIAYESGSDPIGDVWSQSQIRYYIFALLFVMFDVEAVFIFPWATRLEAYGYFGLVEMLIFIFILILGLAYAWRKGVLRWL